VNVKARLFGHPKWELVRVLKDGVRLERMRSASKCDICEKQKAYRFRIVSRDGDASYIFGDSWCSEAHLRERVDIEGSIRKIQPTAD